MLISIIQVTFKRDLRGSLMIKTKVKLSQDKGEKTTGKKGEDILFHRHLSLPFFCLFLFFDFSLFYFFSLALANDLSMPAPLLS